MVSRVIYGRIWDYLHTINNTPDRKVAPTQSPQLSFIYKGCLLGIACKTSDSNPGNPGSDRITEFAEDTEYTEKIPPSTFIAKNNP